MAQIVSSILNKNYGITGRPGQKTTCPFCGHKTFSIKSDDTLGKCFHPDCGKFITKWSDEKNRDYQFLEKVYDLFHRQLVNHPDESSRIAWEYFTSERNIDPGVISDSMVGVIPPGFNISELIEGNESPDPTQTDSSRESQPDIPVKLHNMLFNKSGWLCFFYTDQYHRIRSIKLRKPYTKEFAFFKPFDTAGVFGITTFTPEPGNLCPDDPLLVCEGEFNQLQLQSLCARKAKAESKEPGYVSACAVGGVLGADFETIRAITKKAVICFDHDISGAGFKLVENAREYLNIEAFTTHEPDSDLDDYIRSFGEDYASAWTGIKGLIEGRKHYAKFFEPVAREIYHIRQKQCLHDCRREFEIHNEAVREVISDLTERSKFYRDLMGAYIFMEGEKRLIPIDRDNTEFTLLLAKYGINKTETIYKYTEQELYNYAHQSGEETRVHRHAYYNKKTNRLYLYNFDNQIYRICTEEIQLVNNGTDGILFLSDRSSIPFTIPENGNSAGLIENLLLDKINFHNSDLTIDESRIIVLIWFLSLFFESIMPTKPILAIIGEKGSGKTITLRKTGIILFGDKFNVTPLPHKPEDFDTALTNNSFMAIDNADSRCRWLEDRLAIAATGGTVKKRQLYTTNKLVEIPIHCYLAITSRTPRFQRDDVADRLIIMEVERYEQPISEDILLGEIRENRNPLLGEVVKMIKDVLKALEVNRDYKDSGGFRMADFGNFAMKIAKQSGFEEQMRGIFKKLMMAQSVFTLTADPIFDLLQIWSNEPNNTGHEVTSGGLCKELADLATKENIEFPYREKTQVFAHRLKNLIPNLDHFFEITKRTGGGRRMYYSFRPKNTENKQ